MAAELDRSAQRDYRERLRSRIGELRAKVREVRRDEKLALVQVRALCRRSRTRATDRTKVRRAEVLALLRDETSKLMAEARRACQARTGKVLRRGSKARSELEKQAQALARELAAHKLYREFRTGKPGRSKVSRTERRQESDDEVRGNLDPELVPVFESVKRSIHATPKLSRTEAFLHWAEENPDDVLTIRSEHGERAFERELREHLDQERKIQRMINRKRIKPEEFEALELADLEDAPF